MYEKLTCSLLSDDGKMGYNDNYNVTMVVVTGEGEVVDVK